MKVLILGGTGVISRAIVEGLLNANHEVALFNRGNNPLSFKGEIQQITGDRLDREAFKRKFKKEKFDAVIDMLCFNEADARSTIETFGNNTNQIVICSSIAAYKRPYKTVPTVESEEELHDDPVFSYAFQKAEVERYLNNVIRKDNLPVTIIRPSLTYGSGAVNIGVLRQNYGVVDRIRKGKPLVMFGDGSTSWCWTFAPDLAKAFIGVLGNKFRIAFWKAKPQRLRDLGSSSVRFNPGRNYNFTILAFDFRFVEDHLRFLIKLPTMCTI